MDASSSPARPLFAEGASKVSQNAAAARPQPATPVELVLLELDFELDELDEITLLLELLLDELNELIELTLLLTLDALLRLELMLDALLLELILLDELEALLTTLDKLLLDTEL